MKGKGKWLLLSAVLAFVTSFVLLQTLKSNATQQVVGTPKVAVVVAAATIEEHVKVPPDALKIEQVSQESVPPDALHSMSEAQNAVSLQRIVAGEMLQQAMIAKQDQPGSPFALKVPKGLRAVTISNNQVIGLNGMLTPGDHVDVMAGFKKDEVNTKSDEVKIVLQDIQVLAVGATTTLVNAEQTTNDNKQASGTAGQQKQATAQTTVTLAVSPAQAESLVFADLNGTVRLALRGVQDDASVSTSGVIGENVLKDSR